MDDYQGQEERIIFISTVLSRPESLPPAPAAASATPAPTGAGGAGPGASSDAPQPAGSHRGEGGAGDLHLGFWRNPKRFNVAITRAK